MTAQEVYEDGIWKEITGPTREEITEKALRLWRDHAEEFRILPHEYAFLLEEKRKAKIRTHNLPSSAFKDYPEIGFFEFWNEVDAKAYLDDFSMSGLMKFLEWLEYTLATNYGYISMRDWVRSANYTLAHIGPKKDKTSLFMSADCRIKPNRHRTSSPINGYMAEYG